MCNYLKWCQYIVTFLLIIKPTVAWDSDQLEIFDLVEEINQNFYTVLNITQDADLQAVKKAFRALSLVLHPDKNDSPDAELQFRQLVSVYDVLRDPAKRAHYNDVLRNGLPNWRSAVYYYRHVRKMGLTETLVTLFVVITIGQYLVAWGAYVEKKYTAEQVYGAKLKKQMRKRGGTGPLPDMAELLDIPKPSLKDTLPLQIPRIAWKAAWGAGPAALRLAQWINELRQRPSPPEEESSEEEPMEQRVRQRKRKPGFVPTERPDSELPPPSFTPVSAPNVERSAAPAPVSGGLWTDDDLAELVHLVKKFPGGTTDRWEKIAEAMNRSVPEVTYMAAKLKENCYRLPGQQQQEEEQAVVTSAPKQKTRGGKVDEAAAAAASSWSQLQQKALETALTKHPKGPADRWDKIAKCVPEKTKEECMLRYKYLVELVKKQKEQLVQKEPQEQKEEEERKTEEEEQKQEMEEH